MAIGLTSVIGKAIAFLSFHPNHQLPEKRKVQANLTMPLVIYYNKNGIGSWNLPNLLMELSSQVHCLLTFEYCTTTSMDSSKSLRLYYCLPKSMGKQQVSQETNYTFSCITLDCSRRVRFQLWLKCQPHLRHCQYVYHAPLPAVNR